MTNINSLPIRRSRPLALALLALTTLFCVGTARSADTLDKIAQTKTISIGGVRDSWPFSSADALNHLTGYSIDLCTKVVDAIRRDLKIAELRVVHVPITNAERFPKLTDKSIDMECGSTTITQDRQTRYDFSYAVFVAGMKILSRTNKPYEQPDQLGGVNVALIKGTTSEKLFKGLQEGAARPMKFSEYPSSEEAFKALAAGKVQALPYDDVLLSGITSPLKDKDQYRLSSTYLSVEPYGIMVRKGDARLLAIINRTLTGLFESGEIEHIYKTWFDGESLKVPVSRLLREAIRRPNSTPGFAQLLGFTL